MEEISTLATFSRISREAQMRKKKKKSENILESEAK